MYQFAPSVLEFIEEDREELHKNFYLNCNSLAQKSCNFHESPNITALVSIPEDGVFRSSNASPLKLPHRPCTFPFHIDDNLT